MENGEWRIENMEFLYIGSREGLEKTLLKDAGIKFQAIFTGKLRRYFSFENFVDFLKLPLGFFQSLFYIFRFQPDVIFSKGGYVSVPVVLAAYCLRKKIILHESDLTCGLANRICMRFADQILLGQEESRKNFPNKKSIEVVGIPIRNFIVKGDKKDAADILKFTQKLPVLLIMGGSLGAQAVNEVIWESLKELTQKFNVVHITGKVLNSECQASSIKYPNYRSFEYVDKELPDFYALADAIVSRAGANSLAELSCLNKKVLLIPLPKFASRGDQIDNAKVFVKKYGGIVLMQEELNKEYLMKNLDDLFAMPVQNNGQHSIHLLAADRILGILMK